MPVDDILFDYEAHIEKTHEHLKRELEGIRTGRASPALIEHIRVDYYGSPTELRSIAAISVPEATQLMIRPFSPQDIRAIEKAINDSKIGLTPHSDGKSIRLQLPPLSQERRVQLVGQCKGFGEHAKIAIRNERRDANKLVESEEKGKVITEDEAKRAKEQIQELTKNGETHVDKMLEDKKHEIMQV